MTTTYELLDEELTRVIRQYAPSFEYTPTKDLTLEAITICALALREAGLKLGRKVTWRNVLTLLEMQERVRINLNEKPQGHIIKKEILYQTGDNKITYELFVGIESIEEAQQTQGKPVVDIVGSIQLSKKTPTKLDSIGTGVIILLQYEDALKGYGFATETDKHVLRERIFSQDKITIDKLIQTLQFLNEFPR